MNKDGYTLYKNLIDPEILGKLKFEAVRVFNRQIDRHGITGVNFEENLIELFKLNPKAVINCGKQIQALPELYQLMVSKSLLDLCKEWGLEHPVVNTKPTLFFMNRNLAKEDVYYKTPIHRDFYSTLGSKNSIIIWLPLVDIIEELGPLELAPGSQEKPFTFWGNSNSFGLEGNCKDEDFISIPMNIGDCLVFSTKTIHRSGVNATDTRIRWVSSFRFTDLACKSWLERDYYSPYVYKSVPDREELEKAGIKQ